MPASGGKHFTAQVLAFAKHYCLTGNATESARVAGYEDPEHQGYKLLRQPTARKAIDAEMVASGSECSASIAGRTERLEILTSIVRGEAPDTRHKDRINAATLIAKMNGELIAKTQLTGFDGKPLTVGIEEVPLQDLIAMFKGRGK
jgi:phage terminase small subunit